MKLKELQEISVCNYKTELLKQVETEDMNKIFSENERILYLCNSKITYKLQANRNLKFKGNSAVEKKELIEGEITNYSMTISSDECKGYKFFNYYPGFFEGKTYHLPVFYLGSITKLIQCFITILFLIKFRKEYDGILFYNFFFQTALPSYLAKILLNKKIYLDYEDGYVNRKGFLVEKITQSIVSPKIDGAILINREMINLLPKLKNRVVFNGFIDLSYMKNLIDKEYLKFNFIYTGAIDDIRGGDLLVSFHKELVRLNINSTISVTGYGENVDEIISYSEQNDGFNFFGYLAIDDYKDLMSKVNVALSFQKPDHPFSKYSFPSKIIAYSHKKLPVLILK